MLQNASLLAIVAVDTEENEPIKNEVWWVRRHFFFLLRYDLRGVTETRGLVARSWTEDAERTPAESDSAAAAAQKAAQKAAPSAATRAASLGVAAVDKLTGIAGRLARLHRDDFRDQAYIFLSPFPTDNVRAEVINQTLNEACVFS